MGKRIVVTGRMGKPRDPERKNVLFDGRKEGKLGTRKNPAVVRVASEERSEEVASIFEGHGWQYRIELKPEEPEDIGDLQRLLNPPQPALVDRKIGRNEPCPCGSGKKHKLCCGRS
jgi:SWIM/SEC-C metal-binding protein